MPRIRGEGSDRGGVFVFSKRAMGDGKSGLMDS